MITEKQMKIVNAVNEMKADSAYLGATTVWFHSSGGYFFGCNATNQTICTVEEYNQCIEEMKYHYDIPKWCSYNRADKELLSVENSHQSFYEKETLVYGQDIYVKGVHIASESIKFGCLTLDGNSAILLTERANMVYPVAGISSKPFKSKEDIELEAKENQVIDMISLYYDAYYANDIKGLFNLMQENGDLAPIKLAEEE